MSNSKIFSALKILRTRKDLKYLTGKDYLCDFLKNFIRRQTLSIVLVLVKNMKIFSVVRVLYSD